jgi:VWFA-related protein
MKIRSLALLLLAALAPSRAQQSSSAQTPTIRSIVDEVLLDVVVRDKKGKPVTDLKPSDITVLDNGVKQTLTGFRLVAGSEAIAANGVKTTLDPFRQARLVTLAFESTADAARRKLAREAARDLVQGSQGPNVFYAVVVINTQLSLLQPFTNDKDALTKAIERATEGLGGPGLSSESDSIQAQLRRRLSSDSGAPEPSATLAGAVAAAAQPVANGAQALDAKLASVMLDMLRLDTSVATQGTRLMLSALRTLVEGQSSMPGRKSVLYFTSGMYLGPELDAVFRGLVSSANRNNVTFYALETGGVGVTALTEGARAQLSRAAAASATTTARTSGAVTKDEIMAADNAETSARANVQSAVRDLAESTGGFLIGDSNDLRAPLRRVNEEITSYYELSFNPGIQNYDGSFRKLTVNANRKDLVIHGRSGYYALPPNVRGSGVQPFEAPLLELLTSGKAAADVAFRAAAILLEPVSGASGVMILVELPLHELQTAPGAGGTRLAHCSLVALVKDSKGEIVEKLARDRAFAVTPEQLKGGNFLDRMRIVLPAGAYSLEIAVVDRTSGKAGVLRSPLVVPPPASGVAISSVSIMRSFAPNTRPSDPNDPFRFQGGLITPTLDTTIRKEANGALRLFFTVYQAVGTPTKPTVEAEILQSGRSLTKVPLQLPDADPQGHIPYLMTIPTASIPPGAYDVHVVARQAESSAQTTTTIRIEQ